MREEKKKGKGGTQPDLLFTKEQKTGGRGGAAWAAKESGKEKGERKIH